MVLPGNHFSSSGLLTDNGEKEKLTGVHIPGEMSYDYLRREIMLGTISVNTIVRIALIYYSNICKPILDSTNFCEATEDDNDDDDDHDDFDDNELESDSLNIAIPPVNMNLTLDIDGSSSSQMVPGGPLLLVNASNAAANQATVNNPAPIALSFNTGFQNEHDAMMRYKSLTILHFAMLLDDDALSEYLFDNKVDLMQTTDDCGPVIFLAIAKKKLDYVKRILDSGFLIDYRASAPELSMHSDYSVLEIAVRSNDYNMIEFLISQGAQVNISESDALVSPLVVAAHRGNVKMMKFLIDHGAVIYNEMLRIACQANMSLKVIKFLLKNPAVKLTSKRNNESPNEFSLPGSSQYHEDSILMWPLTYGHKDKVACLLNAGADVNHANVRGEMIYEGLGLDKGCVQIIKKHVIKLIVAGFEVCERNRNNVGSVEYEEFFAKCQNEVEVMKSTPVSGTELTCYELLRKEEEEITACLKHFKKCIVLENYMTIIFPLYGGMLASRLKRCINQCS